MRARKRTTLITGADGYLGRRVAHALLAGSDDHLLLAVRAGNRAEFAAKRERLEHEFAALGSRRITMIAADLRREDALRDVDPAPVTHIVHAAAVTRFNVGRDEALAVNVGGTQRVAQFATACGNLQRLTALSTLYAAGRRQGDIFENRHDDVGFVNNYEWSKWAAEERIWQAYPDLPCLILRLSTVIADDDTGQVSQHNAFHNTLKLYYYGLLSLVPGDPATPINLATAEFTIAAIMQLLEPGVPCGVYHVCPGPEAVPTLSNVIDVVMATFERDSSYARRKLLRPVFCDQASFDDLVDASSGVRHGPIHEAVTSVSPFATQLFLPKVFRNDALRAVWPTYKAPDPIALITTTVTCLVASRWGRSTAEDS
jgi:nucleoside-diphosphate-sugar epimerase